MVADEHPNPPFDPYIAWIQARFDHLEECIKASQGEILAALRAELNGTLARHSRRMAVALVAWIWIMSALIFAVVELISAG